jgi:MFS family permease
VSDGEDAVPADGPPGAEDTAPISHAVPTYHVPTHHIAASDAATPKARVAGPESGSDSAAAEAVPTKGRLGSVRPAGTGDVTITRAIVVRGTYFSRLVAHKVIKASEADGAKESGLTALIWNQVMSYSADAMITVALAGTVFFSASSDAKRGNVLLYLATTIAPFALVAPIIGPALDRFRHGRRWVMAATAIGRAALAIVMALNFTNLFILFPAALGSLVLSKAYAVIRAAAAPRLVPSGLTLVEANARLSMFGLIAALVGGGFVGIAIKVTGSYPFGLWITAAAFAATGMYAVRLPKIVDSPPPEVVRSDQSRKSDLARERLAPAPKPRAGNGPVLARARRRIGSWASRGFPSHVILALQGELMMRWLSGFVTLFLAFYIEATAHGFDAVLRLGALGAGTGLGNFSGTAIGTRLKLARPEITVTVCAIASAACCVLAAVLFSIEIAVLVVLVTAAANSLAKLSLDAVIQRDVAESLRSSAFARSETFLQLGWVLGATIALLLPSDNGRLGFIVTAAVTIGVAALLTLRRRALGLPLRP